MKRNLKFCPPILLPIFALVLFEYLPFGTALAIYLPILLVSLFLCYKLLQAMRLPPKGGMDEMIGQTGEMVEALRPEGRIRVKEEIWYARSSRQADEGARVRIVGNEGLTLIVEPAGENETGRRSPALQPKDKGA